MNLKQINFFSKPVRFCAFCPNGGNGFVEKCPVLVGCKEYGIPTSIKDGDGKVVVNIVTDTIQHMATLRQKCLQCQNAHSK